MGQLLPQCSRAMNGTEGLPLIERAATSAKTEPLVPPDLRLVNDARRSHTRRFLLLSRFNVRLPTAA